MTSERQERTEDKERVEAMVTAILNADPAGQANAADGLTEAEERYVRAGAGIIAGLFTALGMQARVPAAEVWRMSMAGTLQSRGRRG